VAVSSTGTNLAPPVGSVAHLPSAFGKAYQVNTKSALVAVPVAGDITLFPDPVGTLDSPRAPTKVSYLQASPLSILVSSVATVYQVSVCAVTVAVHVILTYGVATYIAAQVFAAD
jgi:hypothetical protein